MIAEEYLISSDEEYHDTMMTIYEMMNRGESELNSAELEKLGGMVVAAEKYEDDVLDLYIKRIYEKDNIDSSASRRWGKSEISLENYKEYLKNEKNNKHDLRFIDLLYISNFKGGNATINVAEKEIESRLESYSAIFNKIEDSFQNKNLSLGNLDNSEIPLLIELVKSICSLAENAGTKIDGFNISRFSALLHSHFPNLIPILDRRVLNGLKLLNEKFSQELNKETYSKLIKIMAILTKVTKKSIRQFDQDLFSIKQLNQRNEYSKRIYNN